MKKFTKAAFALAMAAVLAGSLCSCSNIDNNSSAAVETAVGRVTFSTDKTITSICLKATDKSSGTISVLGNWTDSAALETATISVPVGSYTFILTAKYDGSTVKGTCDGTIEEGKATSLNFTLARTEESDDEDITGNGKEVAGDIEVSTETKEAEVNTSWKFNDLASVSIQGVANDDVSKTDTSATIKTADELAAADATLATFSAASDKFSLKSDVDYVISGITGKIKSLNSDGTPIRYNGFNATVNKCSTSLGASAGALQIVGDSMVLENVEGPFTVKIIYSGNSSTAKTDGRYGYIKIGENEYDDTATISAKSLSQDGVAFTAEYTGTDSVNVTIGASNWVRLYDVIIIKKENLTTTTKTATYTDGSTITVTTVTDEDGNEVSKKIETTAASGSGSSGSGSSDSGTAIPDVAVDPTVNNPADTEEYTNGTKVGRRTKINEVNTNSIKNKIVVTTADEFLAALNNVVEGGAIVINTSKLSFTDSVKILGNGSETGRKYIMPATGIDSVTFDFSGQTVASSSRGIILAGNYWHLYKITVYQAGDNGLLLAGKNNIIERCVFIENQDSGLQISRYYTDQSELSQWPADNLVLNCTAYDNADYKIGSGENADGFAAKLTCGNGNVFDGCISYANSDDGWDLYAKPATGSTGVVTIKNCVAFRNGQTTSSTSYEGGDMNGFKLGGSNGAVPTAHIVYNCLAFDNGHDGFTDNGNGGALQVSGCTSSNNAKVNFNFYRTNKGSFYKLLSRDGVGSERFAIAGNASKVASSLYFNSSKYWLVTDTVEMDTSNCKLGTNVSNPAAGEFKSTAVPSVSTTVDKDLRNSDGTVNVGGYLETASTSTYKALGARFGTEAYTVDEITLKLN